MESAESFNLHTAVRENLVKLHNRIALACERSGRPVSEVRVIAVTKNFPSSVVRVAYDCGLREFGENRVQEARAKYAELNDLRSNIRLNLIGHLQSNKIRDAIELFDIIHSVDSIKLAKALNDRAGKPLSIMLQVNIAGQLSKSGCSVEETAAMLKEIQKMPMLKVEGLMTIAPITRDIEVVRPVFSGLRKLKESLGLRELSMGMTDDYTVAIEEGSTMVRIGRAIFGERRI